MFLWALWLDIRGRGKLMYFGQCETKIWNFCLFKQISSLWNIFYIFKRKYGTGNYVVVAGVSLSCAAGLKVYEKYVRGLIEWVGKRKPLSGLLGGRAGSQQQRKRSLWNNNSLSNRECLQVCKGRQKRTLFAPIKADARNDKGDQGEQKTKGKLKRFTDKPSSSSLFMKSKKCSI